MLKGFELKTDAEVFIHPERFPEERGEEVWNILQHQLEKKSQQTCFKHSEKLRVTPLKDRC